MLLTTGQNTSRKGSLDISQTFSTALEISTGNVMNHILHTVANLHLGLEITQFISGSANVGKLGLCS